MAGRSVDYTANLKAKDEITPAAEDAAAALDKLQAQGDVEVEVDAEGAEEASDQVEEVGEGVEEVDGASASAEVEVDAGDATEQVEEVTEGLDELDGSTAAADVEVDAGDASGQVEEVAATLEELDGTTAEASVDVDADAEAVEEVAAQLDSIDGTEAVATVTTEADLSGVDEVAAGLDSIPDETVAQVRTEGAGQATQETDGLTGALGLMDDAGVKGAGTLAKLGTGASGAAIGIGAAVTAAVMATNAFVDLGREAEAGGKTIGTSTEDYSRWVAVADDVGIAAAEMDAAFLAMNKKIAGGGAAFDEFGIATQDASGKARDSGAIMLDVLDTLAKISDPTERAAAGTQLLGKGYKSLAPLVGESKGAIEEYLGAVSDGQVITEGEAKTAKDMALAQDAVADAFGDVALAFGGALAKLAPLLEGLAELVSWVTNNASALIPLGANLDSLQGSIQGTDNFVTILSDDLALGADAAAAAADASSALADQLTDEADALRDAATAQQERADAMRAAADAQFALTDAQVELNDKVAGLEKALADTNGDVLKQKQLYDEIVQSAGGVADAQVRIAEETAAANGETLSATQKLDAWNGAMLQQAANTPLARNSILDYVAAANGIPAEKLTEIRTLVEQGKLTAAQALLDQLSKNRTSTLQIDGDNAGAVQKTDEAAEYAAQAEALIALGADPTDVNAQIAAAEALADSTTGTVDLDANPADAKGKIKAVETGKYGATVNTSADTAQAAQNLLALISQPRRALIVATVVEAGAAANELQSVARSRVAPIQAQLFGAQSVENQLANLARPRTAAINTTVHRTEVLTRVDGGG